MAKLYISYKLEERDLARQFSEALEKLGHQAVYDAIALAPGSDWRRVLQEAMSQADAVVVLLSELALSSPFIMGEIGAARALHHAFGHVLLLPVLVGDIDIPRVVDDLFVERMTPDSTSIERTATLVVKTLENHLMRSYQRLPRVFISHLHTDAAVVQALVRVLEAAFTIAPNDLRCTSVPPYTLRAGERTSDRLRAELRRAEAVLGVVTPNMKASSYVLFELGASWGRGGVTFPLLARGAMTADIPAPIGDLHTLALHDEAECHQLLDDLANVITLHRREQNEELIARRIDELLSIARATD